MNDTPLEMAWNALWAVVALPLVIVWMIFAWFFIEHINKQGK